jgi:hypothetical protein
MSYEMYVLGIESFIKEADDMKDLIARKAFVEDLLESAYDNTYDELTYKLCSETGLEKSDCGCAKCIEDYNDRRADEIYEDCSEVQ